MSWSSQGSPQGPPGPPRQPNPPTTPFTPPTGQFPPPTGPPKPGRKRGQWGVGLALAAACGVLVGVLFTAALGGLDDDDPVTISRTITQRAETVTVPGPTVTAPAPTPTTPDDDPDPPGGGPQGGSVEVPDVTGETISEATQRIEDAGLEVDVFGGGLLDPGDDWTVIIQQPDAGTTLERGDSVRLIAAPVPGG